MSYKKFATCLAVLLCRVVFVQAGIFQITDQPGHQGQPAIWGDWIVWSDIQQQDLSADIYAKNLATGEIIQISNSGLAKTADIYANTIVWADQRNGDYDLFSYDLSTRTESQLYSAPDDQINPAIHGDKVVFMTGQDPYTRQIWLYSIGQQQARLICSVPGYKWKPDIFENIVVWGDYRSENWDIYGYDIVSQTEFLIAGGEDYQRTAAISGDRVVYENNTNAHQGPSYIGIYDLGTAEHSYLEVPNTVDWPDIYGDILVWAEYTRASATNIYGYDLSDDTEYIFSTKPGWQYSPKIYADTIVWASDETAGVQWYDRDIYGYDLDLVINTPPVISSVTANPSTINDNQTSQLQVNANDPDSGPAALSYNWIVQAGQGSLSSTSIPNPVYTPPDVTETQSFTLTVQVSDDKDTVSDTVTVTVDDSSIPPVISSVTAVPSNITDNQTSQLQVNANDPDSGPAALSYNWIVPAGAGSLSSTTVANPVYTPPDVTGTQIFNLTVQVFDGKDTIWSNVNVTVTDAYVSGPTTLLFDDFDDGDFDGFSIIDEGTMFAPSSWLAASGSMVQSSNINSEPFLASDLNKLGTFAVYNAQNEWSDYKVNVTMRSDDNDQIGLLFRYQDTGNYYKFCWNKQFATRKLLKKVDQTVTLLASDNVPYVTGQNYQVQITATGSSITVAIDGTTIFWVTDNSLLTGTIALYCWANAGSIFDNITVEDLSIPNLPPAISSIWAWPATIMDNQTSQLSVTADDPDSSPAALTYDWIIPAGQGSFSSTTVANPVYTPPDVTDTQNFTLTVQVSDGKDTVSDTVTVTVDDSSIPPVISSVTAVPSNITDNQTSQLQVNANDPDSGPAALSYNWIIPAGAGSLSSTSISNPVYAPPDVTDTRIFTMIVLVSDGNNIVVDTVTITVDDSYTLPTVPKPIHNLTKDIHYETIQLAINHADNNDVIEALPGTYRENINFKNKNIVLKSSDPSDPDIVANTIIDGNDPIDLDYGATVTFAGGENQNCALIGFTITGGTGNYHQGWTNFWSYWGGGIFIAPNSSPIIAYNIITGNLLNGFGGANIYCAGNNQASIIHNIIEDGNCLGEPGYQSYAGGIFCEGAQNDELLIAFNTIRNNHADRGAAISCSYSANPLIKNNLIYDNRAKVIGGAIHLYKNNANIINNTITYNEAPMGSAIHCFLTKNPRITNNIIAFNIDGPAFSTYYELGSALVSYCDFWQNQGGDFGWQANTFNPNWTGNIFMDPYFADQDNDDFHLMSQAGRWKTNTSDVIDSLTSPCIDTGDPIIFAGWEPRPNGDRINMGAYGCTYQASKSYLTLE